MTGIQIATWIVLIITVAISLIALFGKGRDLNNKCNSYKNGFDGGNRNGYQPCGCNDKFIKDKTATNIEYGCHVDLEEHMKPDGCVIDTNEHNLCVYAKKGMKKEECKYWQPIEKCDEVKLKEHINKEEFMNIAESIGKSWNKGYNGLAFEIADKLWEYLKSNQKVK